ncbi:TniQ family protein [Paraburkholderia sp.]|uniref:TniQ family protein n=1 Tax=Paraburkholderia sp. TaxID=1926495 RepID=UPI002579D822|nr:TniQ family protein [Paraburkholderia sp.]
MAIALFPLLDGETIGSNIARYGEFMGAETTLSLRRRLFGYACKPDTRLPSGVKHLAEQARDYWNLNVASIIRGNTEFYYATATVPVKQRESMFSDMLKQPASRCLRRSASGWTGERVFKFRYCEDCLMEWREKGIPPHWLVDHQLPGVYVCPVHSSMLKIAKQRFPQNLTDPTVMALKEADDEEIVARASLSERSAIANVAKLSGQYRMAKSSLPLPATYRELLRAAGFVWPTGGVDIRAFTTSILEYFGPEYCQLVGLSLQKLATWLRNIAHEGKSGELSHPFMFISAESLLNTRCASPGSFIPAIRNEDVGIEVPATENIDDNSHQRRRRLLCNGILHRANDEWEKCSGDDFGWKFVCSCGLSYKASEVSHSVEADMSVKGYGKRYQDLISMRFADNFCVGHSSQGLFSVNPRFLRWARFSGFSAQKAMSEEEIQNLRERWCSVVRKSRPDKRITSSYQLDSKLYRTLYQYDRNWISEFNRANRTRPLRSQRTVKGGIDPASAEGGR